MSAEHDVAQATADAGGDRLLAALLKLAAIEALLSAAITGNEVRFGHLEATDAAHELRLNDKGKQLARHDERIGSNTQRIVDLESDDRLRRGSRNSSIALVLAVPSALVALYALLHVN